MIPQNERGSRFVASLRPSPLNRRRSPPPRLSSLTSATITHQRRRFLIIPTPPPLFLGETGRFANAAVGKGGRLSAVVAASSIHHRGVTAAEQQRRVGASLSLLCRLIPPSACLKLATSYRRPALSTRLRGVPISPRNSSETNPDSLRLHSNNPERYNREWRPLNLGERPLQLLGVKRPAGLPHSHSSLRWYRLRGQAAAGPCCLHSYSFR